MVTYQVRHNLHSPALFHARLESVARAEASKIARQDKIRLSVYRVENDRATKLATYMQRPYAK